MATDRAAKRGLTLSEAVPWGRSLDEYIRMFNLTPDDLAKHIVGVGDGPASFSSELTARGGHVVSVDPIYQFTSEQIRSRIPATVEKVRALMQQNHDRFHWFDPASPEEMTARRLAAMDLFLSDFENARGGPRYVEGSLPSLPFRDRQFDLALCSHFLFLYDDVFDDEFHISSIEEMLRVASQVRIYPTVSIDATASPRLEKVMQHFGPRARLVLVEYRVQKGAHEMLVLTSG